MAEKVPEGPAEVEIEISRFSIFCKEGRKAMEDRHVAVVDLQGDAKQGGYVDCCRGVWRLQETLAMSRGLGDSHLRKWVIPEPETMIISLKPECEFLILASDGLWDKVSNHEAVDMVRPLFTNFGDSPVESHYQFPANVT